VTASGHGALSGQSPTWTYTPATNYHGVDTLTVRAVDGNGSATATVTITIAAVNDPPVAVPDTATTSESTPVVIAAATLLANDNDADGDTLALSAVAATAGTHGTVTLADGAVTYTPADAYSGTADFTYTVSDGHGGMATGAWTIFCANARPAPTALVSEPADLPAPRAMPSPPRDRAPTGRAWARASGCQPRVRSSLSGRRAG
jgi:hypothetical protein